MANAAIWVVALLFAIASLALSIILIRCIQHQHHKLTSIDRLVQDICVSCMAYSLTTLCQIIANFIAGFQVNASACLDVSYILLTCVSAQSMAVAVIALVSFSQSILGITTSTKRAFEIIALKWGLACSIPLLFDLSSLDSVTAPVTRTSSVDCSLSIHSGPMMIYMVFFLGSSALATPFFFRCIYTQAYIMWGEAHMDTLLTYSSSTQQEGKTLAVLSGGSSGGGGEEKKSRIGAAAAATAESKTARPVDAPVDMTIARNLSMLEKMRRNSFLYSLIPCCRLLLMLSVKLATPSNGVTPDAAATVIYLFNITSMLFTPLIYAYCHDAYRFKTFAVLFCIGGLGNAVEDYNSHSHSKTSNSIRANSDGEYEVPKLTKEMFDKLRDRLNRYKKSTDLHILLDAEGKPVLHELNLSTITSHKASISVAKRVLNDEYSPEMIHFKVAVSGYKKMWLGHVETETLDRQAEGQNIVDRFIRDGSPQQINIKDIDRHKTQAAFEITIGGVKELDGTEFDGAVQQVDYLLVAQNFMEKFRKHPTFPKIAIALMRDEIAHINGSGVENIENKFRGIHLT